jgi:hypothetical protein
LTGKESADAPVCIAESGREPVNLWYYINEKSRGNSYGGKWQEILDGRYSRGESL